MIDFSNFQTNIAILHYCNNDRIFSVWNLKVRIGQAKPSIPNWNIIWLNSSISEYIDFHNTPNTPDLSNKSSYFTMRSTNDCFNWPFAEYGNLTQQILIKILKEKILRTRTWMSLLSSQSTRKMLRLLNIEILNDIYIPNFQTETRIWIQTYDITLLK